MGTGGVGLGEPMNIREYNRDECTGCTACYAVCKREAISMLPDAEGFLQPVIDDKKCVQCGLCAKVCPLARELPRDAKAMCFAYKSPCHDILMASTSGGAFSLITQSVFDKGGCVFGVVMSPGLTAVHAKAENAEQLSAMRGSKYVQSDVGNALRECKKELERGRAVLFSGTSCQIAGLKSFLGRDYANLTTVDLICHGVPSPGVFAQYKREVESRECKKIARIFFRHKNVERRFALSLEFSNDNAYSNVKYDRAFFDAFINDLCLRRSCHVCHFRDGRSGSDFTIADFWQVEGCGVGMEYSEDGCSLVIAHTDKAKVFMRKFDAVPFDRALRGNPSYFKAPPLTDRRARFFKLISQMSVQAATEQILRGGWLRRHVMGVLRRSKRMLMKVCGK